VSSPPHQAAQAPLVRFLSPSASAGPRCAVRRSQSPDDPASAFASPLRCFAAPPPFLRPLISTERNRSRSGPGPDPFPQTTACALALSSTRCRMRRALRLRVIRRRILHGGVTDPPGAVGAASPAHLGAGNAPGVRALRSFSPARRSARRLRHTHPTCRFPDIRLDAFLSRGRPPEF
jgi:hypothetical protein